MAFSEYNSAVLLAGSLSAFIVLRYTFLVIYRLYFSPLSKFPGPKLWALSPVPGIVSLLKGRISFDYKVLHDKYGPVVRVGPNEVSFNTVDAWNDIYGHRQGMPNMDKDPIHVGAVEAIPGATNLTMSNDADHSRQRRILAHAFSQKALIEQEPILNGYVDKLVSNLHRMSRQNLPINMVNWYNFTTFDIIGDLSFGEPFGCLEEGEAGESQKWVVLIYESIKSGALEQATRRFADVGTYTQKFLMWLTPTIIRERRKRHLRNSIEKTKKRMARDTDHKDFLWYILDKKQRKNEITENELIANAALFIVAGSETTATLLSGLTNMLMRDKRSYQLLTSEIRNAFDSEEDISIQKLMDLPYLNACLEEGLRIFPPVPVALLRTVPKGGAEIDGHFVPGGTAVAVSSWAAAHSAANFVNPDTFIPERWFDPAYSSDLKKASQPFSLGPRGCIGRHLGYVEMRLIMGRVLYNFDLEFYDEATVKRWSPENEFQNLRAFNTWEKPPLLARLTPAVKSEKVAI